MAPPSRPPLVPCAVEKDAYRDFAPILLGGGVDLLFVGHVHYYNRRVPFNPVTGQTDAAAVSPDGHTYTDPAYFTTIVTGAAGDHEKESSCRHSESYSMVCSENYGYGILQATNATHIVWTFKTVKPVGNGTSNFEDVLTIVKSPAAGRRSL
jgi:hypothetical protein